MRGFNPSQQNGSSGAPPPVVLSGNDKGVLAHDLMVELMGTIPTFGGTKVVVGFYGDQAFCNEKLKYVNIPQLPASTVIPTRIAMEIRGFAAHESAHLIWTDAEGLQNAKTPEEKQNPLLHQTWNCIEDYMIERNWLLLYPGAHKNFTATEERCCTGYMESYRKHPDMAKDLRIIGPIALTWCRSIHFGLKTQLSTDCLKTLPAALQQRVWGWFHDMIDVETTLECLELARKIVADINANPFDPANPPANPNHNPLQGQQGQGQPGQGGAGAGGGQKGQGSFGGQTSPGNGGAGGQGQNPTPYNTSHSLSQAYNEIGAEAPENGHLSFSLPSSTESGPAAEILKDAEGIPAVQALQPEMSSTIGTVSRVLRRALQSMSRDRWKGGRADGRIDDKRLAGVLIGNQEIYKKLIEAEEIDTAVEILVDCSGSMNNGGLALCQKLALVLQASFAGTPIKFEILGFTSGGRDELPENAQIMYEAICQQNPGEEPDVRPIHIYEFKSFGANHQVALTTIGNMLKVPMGGTPTADAILIAHERLAKRPERRHVMFVLTDGAPDDNDACKQAVDAVEKCNVTVLGIGIQSDAVQNAFNDYVVLAEARDLSAAVLSKISEMVFKDRLKVGLKPRYDKSHIRAA